MRWRGPRRHRRARSASRPALLALRASRQGQAPVRKPGFPVFPASRSFPRVVPVSNGESISIVLTSAAQELSADYFKLFSVSTLFPQIAGGFPQVMVVIHGTIHSPSTRYRG